MLIDLLEALWEQWTRIGTDLTDAQWTAPTRLPGWRVAEVYAHHGTYPVLLGRMIAAPTPDGPVTHATAGALLAAFNAPDGPAYASASTVRDHAIGQADTKNRDSLVARFATAAPATIAALRDDDPDRSVDYGGLAVLPLAQILRIGLLESVVHYLDVARAADLDVPGPVAGAPLRETAALLTEVADPVTFVEGVTGRSTVDFLPIVR